MASSTAPKLDARWPPVREHHFDDQLRISAASWGKLCPRQFLHVGRE